MAVPWGLVVFVIGLLQGWLTPGTQPKKRLFGMAFLIGLVVGAIAGIIAWISPRYDPLGMGNTGVFGFLVNLLIIALVYVLGVWIGDLLERAWSPRRRTA